LCFIINTDIAKVSNDGNDVNVIFIETHDFEVLGAVVDEIS
jgi:hypothetical protein